METIPQAISGK